MNKLKKQVFAAVAAMFLVWTAFPAAVGAQPSTGFVAIMDMNMMILPGTAGYLEDSIAAASEEGAKVLVIKLNTPGGILDTTQRMIQSIFQSPIPVIIYVSPAGSTAASAGVFITMAGHVAAMAPGTSIGAAHPVAGDGKNIDGDMRTKAENMTVAMVKSIADRRGRNFAWAEKAVKESASVTEKEALKENVIDVVADDVDDLIRKIKGREVRLDSGVVKLDDYSALSKRVYEMSAKHKALNILSNPNVAALLWMAATAGISLELYNPGVVLPGVVGVICLILALSVSSIIPVSMGAVSLIVVGALLIGAELYTGSLVLGVGGIIAMVLGAMYLIDVSQAPGLSVALEFIVPVALLVGLFLLFVARRAFAVLRRRSSTGLPGIVGQRGRAVENVFESGRVFVNGEYWNAVSGCGLIESGTPIEVCAVREGMTLEVKKVGQ